MNWIIAAGWACGGFLAGMGVGAMLALRCVNEVLSERRQLNKSKP